MDFALASKVEPNNYFDCFWTYIGVSIGSNNGHVFCRYKSLWVIASLDTELWDKSRKKHNQVKRLLSEVRRLRIGPEAEIPVP